MGVGGRGRGRGSSKAVSAGRSLHVGGRRAGRVWGAGRQKGSWVVDGAPARERIRAIQRRGDGSSRGGLPRGAAAAPVLLLVPRGLRLVPTANACAAGGTTVVTAGTAHAVGQLVGVVVVASSAVLLHPAGGVGHVEADRGAGASDVCGAAGCMARRGGPHGRVGDKAAGRSSACSVEQGADDRSTLCFEAAGCRVWGPSRVCMRVHACWHLIKPEPERTSVEPAGRQDPVLVLLLVGNLGVHAALKACRAAARPGVSVTEHACTCGLWALTQGSTCACCMQRPPGYTLAGTAACFQPLAQPGSCSWAWVRQATAAASGLHSAALHGPALPGGACFCSGSALALLRLTQHVVVAQGVDPGQAAQGMHVLRIVHILPARAGEGGNE